MRLLASAEGGATVTHRPRVARVRLPHDRCRRWAHPAGRKRCPDRPEPNVIIYRGRVAQSGHFAPAFDLTGKDQTMNRSMCTFAR